MSLLAVSKFTDLNPTTTSNAKVAQCKTVVITRAMTAATQIMTLPAAAYILAIYGSNVGGVAANGLTSSTINVLGGIGATQLVAIDVKTAVAPNIPYPANLDTAAAAAGGDAFDQIIKAQYVDVGGAATVGGPWTLTVEYIL